MAIVTPPFALQNGSHTAQAFRALVQGLTGSPFGSFAGGVGSTAAGGGHGVVGATDLAVAQNGTPNMSVNVAGGLAFVRGTENANQGVYAVLNDATVNLVVAASDPTNPRRDLVCLKLQDAFYSGAVNAASLVVVTGTPAGSPVDPTPPADALVLARISVAALSSSVVNANITDLRTRAAALGGVQVCTSTTRPSAPTAGQLVFETDTGNVMLYTGAAWTRTGGSGAWTSYTPTWSGTLGNGTLTGAYQRFGRTIHFRVKVLFGSTTTVGGNQQFTLPFLPNADYGDGARIGNAGGLDAGVAAYSGSARMTGVSTTNFLLQNENGTAWSSTVPWTVGTSDTIYANGTYEAAAD